MRTFTHCGLILCSDLRTFVALGRELGSSCQQSSISEEISVYWRNCIEISGRNTGVPSVGSFTLSTISEIDVNLGGCVETKKKTKKNV